MISLSNGHKFEYMAASGALGPGGKGWLWEQPLRWLGLLDVTLFTTVLKTITLFPRRGNYRWYNPFRCVRVIRDGVHNAFGLTNGGLDWWCRKIGPKIDSKRAPAIGSIFGETGELVEMTRRLNDFDLVGLELNDSCPNSGDDLLGHNQRTIEKCEAVANESRFPVILKVSPVHDVENIVPHIGGWIEALSINSVPKAMFCPDQPGPFDRFGGGAYSGKVAQPFTWAMVDRLVALSSIPVIGPSVWDYPDIAGLRRRGVKAISFGGIFLPHPLRPTAFVRRDLQESAGNAG